MFNDTVGKSRKGIDTIVFFSIYFIYIYRKRKTADQSVDERNLFCHEIDICPVLPIHSFNLIFQTFQIHQPIKVCILIMKAPDA